MPPRTSSAVLIALLAVAACNAVTEPSGFVVPEEDLSLDPSHLSVGHELYYCNDWHRSAGKPVQTAMFADVFFVSTLDHPLPSHRSLVESVGATVVHTYAAPGFRVWIQRESIPALSQNGLSIRSVPDPSRYDVQVSVAYNVRFVARDSARIAALGGRVTRNFDPTGVVILFLPSRMLNQVRADPRVRWVAIDPDFICPG